MNGSGNPYRRRERPEPALADAPPILGGTPPDAPAPAAAPPPPPPPVAGPQTDLAGVVEHCYALYEQRAYADVATTAASAIAAHASAGDAADRARLWSIVALAQAAMEDHAAARRALESAIVVAPAAERAAYERQLATLAANAAQALVARAEGVREPASDEAPSALRAALEWCDRGTAVAPDDTPLRELAAEVQRRLWGTYERVVLALVQRQHYGDARGLLREALEDPRLPAARAEPFREMLSGTYGGEIGQLTAQAIRSMQDAREAEALAALERAEALLDAVAAEVLPPKRREEVDRRLWWGYKKLGRRRAQAGEHEAAAQALCHALRFAGDGTDRQADTRAALVRALEALVDKRAPLIRELAASGDREGALMQSDRLRSQLRDALRGGLAEQDLAVAFARAQRVVDEVGIRP
jgi:hypothetical protein